MIVATETGFFRVSPTVVACKCLWRHKALLGGGNVVGWHAEDALVTLGIDDGPFYDAETGNLYGPLDGLHLAKVTSDGLMNEVGLRERYGNSAAGVETYGKEVWFIAYV